MTQERTLMFQVPSGLSGTLACVEGTMTGRSWALTSGTFVIGRLPDCDLPLSQEPGVSKTHAKIVAEGDRYVLVDCESRNGSLVNGAAVQRAVLCDGDEIRICGCLLRFTQHGEGDANTSPGTTPVAQGARMEDSGMAVARPGHAPGIADDDAGLNDAGLNDAGLNDAGLNDVEVPSPDVAFGAGGWPHPENDALSPGLSDASFAGDAIHPSATASPGVPSRTRVLLSWYAGGLAGALLLGIPGAVMAKTSRTPSAAVAPAPSETAPIETAPIETAPIETAPIEPSPPALVPGGAAERQQPLEDAAANPTPVAQPVDVAKLAPAAVEERPPPTAGGVSWTYPATPEAARVEVIRSTASGRVRSVDARAGDTLQRGQAFITFESSVDTDEVATLRDRVASLEGAEGEDARRAYQSAKARLDALTGGAAPVSAPFAGRLVELAVTVGDVVQTGQAIGQIRVDNEGRVRITAVREHTVVRGTRVTLVLQSGAEAYGRVVQVSGQTVIIDTERVAPESVESVRF